MMTWNLRLFNRDY